jgi:hypothetical protein
VHARDRDGFLARQPIVQRDNAAAIHTPRNFVLLLARSDAAIAFDAPLGIAEEFHSRHDFCSSCYAFWTWHNVVFVSCIIVTMS